MSTKEILKGILTAETPLEVTKNGTEFDDVKKLAITGLVSIFPQDSHKMIVTLNSETLPMDGKTPTVSKNKKMRESLRSLLEALENE